MPVDQTNEKLFISHVQFVKWKQFNPTNHFCKEQPNEDCLIVENKFNPISHRPCVYFGTKIESSHCNI